MDVLTSRFINTSNNGLSFEGNGSQNSFRQHSRVPRSSQLFTALQAATRTAELSYLLIFTHSKLDKVGTATGLVLRRLTLSGGSVQY